ncbi:MAG: PEP/pyruvate-binding domain-containing protein [Desulfatiglandaceae bacterium]
MEDPYVVWFEDLSSEDVSKVGGKNASLGEMIGTLKEEGIRVPDGFATTAEAYQEFLEQAGIKDAIQQSLTEYRDEQKPLDQVGRTIRGRFLNVSFPEEIEEAIKAAYRQLCDRYDTKEVDVAVRSSATAEDLPDASFAGQQESFLNVTGTHELLDACRKCYASLFTDRAISYREEKGFDHMKVALSIGVQKMVRSDLSGSGVMFSIDTETGFPHVAVIM